MTSTPRIVAPGPAPAPNGVLGPPGLRSPGPRLGAARRGRSSGRVGPATPGATATSTPAAHPHRGGPVDPLVAHAPRRARAEVLVVERVPQSRRRARPRAGPCTGRRLTRSPGRPGSRASAPSRTTHRWAGPIHASIGIGGRPGADTDSATAERVVEAVAGAGHDDEPGRRARPAPGRGRARGRSRPSPRVPVDRVPAASAAASAAGSTESMSPTTAPTGSPRAMRGPGPRRRPPRTGRRPGRRGRAASRPAGPRRRPPRPPARRRSRRLAGVGSVRRVVGIAGVARVAGVVGVGPPAGGDEHVLAVLPQLVDAAQRELGEQVDERLAVPAPSAAWRIASPRPCGRRSAP